MPCTPFSRVFYPGTEMKAGWGHRYTEDYICADGHAISVSVRASMFRDVDGGYDFIRVDVWWPDFKDEGYVAWLEQLRADYEAQREPMDELHWNRVPVFV